MAEGTGTVSARVIETGASMSQMITSLKSIAQSVEVLAQSADESSSSILEMAATNTEVAENIQSLAASVEETTAAIEQMTSSIKEVANNIEELSATAEETSSAMNEMDVSISQVETNATETAKLSEQALRDAELSTEALSRTLAGIERIKGSSAEAASVIDSLGRKIGAIGNILNVIDEVAEQTNLLALNAAILAAQSGEHGKGFAVVADEIKDLAERTGASTKEIAELIRSVQDESSNAIGAMDRGVKNVEEGVRLGQEAEAALKKIQASSVKSTQMVKAIARATLEQARGSKQVTGAFNRIAETVQQIATATAEQARGSEQIMRSAEKMKLITKHVERSSQEQARGSKQITKAIESISEMVNHLHRAQKDQTKGSELVMAAVDQIRGVAEAPDPRRARPRGLHRRPGRAGRGAARRGEAVPGVTATRPDPPRGRPPASRSRWRWRAPGVPLPLAARGLLPFLQRWPRLVAAVLYALLVALASARLWPVAGAAFAGEAARASPALWRLWWMKEVLLGADGGGAPFATNLLGWPGGARVAGLDAPGALLALPLWAAVPSLPEVALANGTALLAWLLAALLAFELAREVWGGTVIPLLSGALFALAPGPAALLGGMEARAAPWAILFMLGAFRTLRRRGVQGPLLAALGLALAAAASRATLAACAAGGVALACAWALRQGRSLRDPALLRRALLFALAAALLLAPQLPSLLRSAPRGAPIDPGDSFLASLLLPWRGSPLHVGWVLLGLGLLGAVRSRAARPWLAAALAGGLLLSSRAAPGAAWLVALGLAIAAGAAMGPSCSAAGAPPAPRPCSSPLPSRSAGRACRSRRPAARRASCASSPATRSRGRCSTSRRRPAPSSTRCCTGTPSSAIRTRRWPFFPLPGRGAFLAAAKPREACERSEPRRRRSHPGPGRGGAMQGTISRRRLLPHGTAGAAGPSAPSPGPLPGRRELQALGVRLVLADAASRPAAQALGLPQVAEDDGLWVYEVPVKVR